MSASGSNSTSARSRASRTSPTQEAAAVVANDRESNGRDLFEAIEGGNFPKWTLSIQVMTEAAGPDPQAQSVRPDQGVAEGRLSADRGRRDGAQPLSRQLLRRDRAGRLLAGQHRSRHRLLAGQDAAGPALLLRRYAALSARRQLQPHPGERAEMPVPSAITATARCGPTATSARRRPTGPTARARGWIATRR